MKLAEKIIFVAWLLLGLLSLRVQGNNGGATGEDGSIFLSGTPFTGKLAFGTNCWKASSTANLQVQFTVYENDTDFKVADGGPNNNNIVTWTCSHLNVASYTGNVRNYEFGSGCNMSRLDSDFGTGNSLPTPTDPDERTLSIKHDISSTATTAPCGGSISGNVYTFIVTCQRDVNFHQHFDVDVQYSCDGTKALITVLSNSTQVSNIPVRNVTRRTEVDMKCYNFRNGASPDLSKEKTATTANILLPGASGLKLGDAMRCEWCIAIKAGDDRTLFTPTIDAMGLQVKELKFFNDEATNPVVVGFAKEVNTIIDGCGLGKNPAKELFNKTAVPYTPAISYRIPTGITKHTLTSPNCFISDLFSVVGFNVQNKNSNSKVTIRATLAYCFTDTTTGGINSCFGDLATTSNKLDGYENCSLKTAGRRKRSEEELDLPEEVEYSYYLEPVDPDYSQIATDKPSDKPCFEKLTFSILTAALSFLFAVVIMMAVFLACKIESAKRDEKMSRSSQSGFSNKGYY